MLSCRNVSLRKITKNSLICTKMDYPSKNSKNEPAQWFVMNAYRKEKSAEIILENKGFQYFIPKHYVIRSIAGKPKRLLVPVIPNLVFINGKYDDINAFQNLYPFISFATMRKEGKNVIMKVPDKEMENFIIVASKLDEDIMFFKPEEIELKKGMKVRILDGPFKDSVGILQKIKGKRNKRLVVEIEGMISAVASYIKPEFIQIIEK